MGFTYHFEGGILHWKSSGNYDLGDEMGKLHACLREAQTHPQRPDQGWPILFDLTQSSETRTGDELRQISNALAQHREAHSAHLAIVVIDKYLYGLARMLGAYGEAHGFETVIFDEKQKALDWLRNGAPG